MPLTDGSAHAWIEIYLDGYGWIPYDTTPPSDENDVPVNMDFFSLFSGLFTTTNRAAANGNNAANNIQLPSAKGSFAFLSSLSFLLRPLGILLAALIIFILSFPLIRFVREEYSIRRFKSRGEFSDALLIYYRRFIKKLISGKLISVEHPTIRDSYDMLVNSGVDGTPVDEAEAAALRDGIEQAAFGRSQLSEGEFIAIRDMIKELMGKIKKPRKK